MSEIRDEIKSQVSRNTYNKTLLCSGPDRAKLGPARRVGAAATLGLRSSPAGEAGRAGSEAAKRSRP